MSRWLASLVGGASALACACAAPRLPREYPAGSPASPRAEAAPVPAVAPMLRGDPPLPGDARAAWDEWPGLEREVTGGAHRGPAGHEPSPEAPPEPDHAHH
jgi:hypothetical protein